MLFASPLLLSLLYYIVFWGVGWEDLPYLFTSTSADVRYHRTTAWQGDSPFGLTRLARANIYTRTVAQDSPVLLLTRAEVEQSYDRTAREYTVVSWTRVAAVYLYDPSEDRLEVVPNDTWEQASGSIGECGRASLTTNKVHFDKLKGRLRLNWHPVKFAGRYLIGVARSPSGARVAVLSSAGIRGPNFMPSSGSGRIRGQRYHQTYSLEEDQFLGKPVLLPSDESELGWSEPAMCWTEDERYVVYSTSVNGLVIVPSQRSGGGELR
jgi:hypothetical protein